MANICQLLNITAPSDDIPHLCTQQWLRDTAEMIVASSIMPRKSNDPVHSLHRSLIHLGYQYVDLRQAIRWEDGPQIIRHWKFWLSRFIATGMKNYSTKSVRLLTNLSADYPKHVAYTMKH